MNKPSMRAAVHRVLYWTLGCSHCGDCLEAFPPETRNDLVEIARGDGWQFRKGEVLCGKCVQSTKANPKRIK